MLPPLLFVPAQADGSSPLATPLSLGPPCHSCLPSAIDSLGTLCGFWPLRQSQDPGTRWGAAYITHSGNVLPPLLVGVHGINLLECSGRHLHVEKHAASRWSGRSSAANQHASYRSVKPRVCSSRLLRSRPLKYQAALKIRSIMNVDTAGKRAEGLLKRQPEQKQRSLICIPEISFALKSIKTFYLIARSVCVCVATCAAISQRPRDSRAI